ncbi:MAG: DinB family protein [Chloroflexi bacterium]|nr:DinB family protein [Chloroflexota bacterium]
MDKTTLLETLKAERARWDALLAGIGEARMVQAGAPGEMPLKDIVAHITWYEQEMVGLINRRALAGSDLWNLPPEARNAAILEASRARSPDDIRTEAQRVHEQLVAGVQSLAEEELADAAMFREMPADWVPWELIAMNSYEHYRQHSADVRARLARP